MPNKKQSGFVSVLIIIVLITLGTGIGFLLFKQPQIFKSQASSNLNQILITPIQVSPRPTSPPAPMPTLEVLPSPATPINLSNPDATPSPAINFNCSSCQADINQDGIVNYKDYSTISGCMGKNANSLDLYNQPCNLADIDRNSQVDWPDFLCVQSQYTQRCTQ